MPARRWRPPAWSWILPGLAAGLAAAAVFFSPAVNLTSPPAGRSSLPATTSLSLEFDQPMDQASVEAHLRLEPRVAGAITWEGNVLTFRPQAVWPSGSEVRVSLTGGARSARGLPLWRGYRWSFSVGMPRVVFLWPANAQADLYSQVPDQADPVRLTNTPHGIIDYSLGADGTRLVYSAERDAGETEIRELDLVTGADRLLSACPSGWRCTSPVLSPDGLRLAFERSQPSPPSLAGSPPAAEIWWIDLGEMGQPERVSEPDHVASSPLWSSRGWLAYVDSTLGAIRIIQPGPGGPVNLATIPSQSGERGSWAPNGDAMVFTDLLLPVEGASSSGAGSEGTPTAESHLMRWDVATGKLTDLSAPSGVSVEDSAPAYSPDGTQISFGRRVLKAGEWTPGKQLWILEADGTRFHPLTDDAFVNFGGVSWSYDGTRLATMRYDLEHPSQPAEIWVVDVTTQAEQRLISGGYQPTWIP